MSNELNLTGQNTSLANPAGTLCAFRDLEQMFRVADYLAKSPIVPAAFQGQPGSVMIALNMAQRLRMDPFMVMQNIYVVHGTPAMSGKFTVALLNRSPKYTHIEYQYVNGKDYTDGMRVVGHRRDGKTDIGTAITPEMVAKEKWGNKWQTMPEQMYRYRAAAFFARAFTPEELFGMQTVEEVEDVASSKPAVRNVTPEPKAPSFLPTAEPSAPAAEVPTTDTTETTDEPLPLFGTEINA